MSKNVLKIVYSEMVRLITAPLRLLPIKKNRILFTGLTGGSGYEYSCNPRYVYEYMREYFPGEYEYIWAVSDRKRYSFLEEEGVKVVKHFTVSSFPMLLTSNVIVTNGSYVPWFPFRKDQYVINTWHGGGAYKKVENEKPGADWATRKRAEFCANNIDLFVASCKVQEDEMIRTTYQYKGEVLRAGTPRNDKLVNGDVADMAKKVRDYYKIEDDRKILLYAPTYRVASPAVVFDADKITTKLEQHGEKWVVLSRFHRYQEQSMNISVVGDSVIDVAQYTEMQELLCAADILITDYSSCVWDYSFLQRPCLLYVPDKEEYNKNVGFYVSMERWPFLSAQTMDELIECVISLKKREVLDELLCNMQAHLEELGSYESGRCRESIAKKIEGQING